MNTIHTYIPYIHIYIHTYQLVDEHLEEVVGFDGIFELLDVLGIQVLFAE